MEAVVHLIDDLINNHAKPPIIVKESSLGGLFERISEAQGDCPDGLCYYKKHHSIDQHCDTAASIQ